MSAPSFKLKANANSRVLTGHPWVFANEVEAPLPAECDGEVVECRDRMGRMLGTGICNGRSQIVWRRLSRDRVALDEAYLDGAIQRAIARRAPGDFRRLVDAGGVGSNSPHSEASGGLFWDVGGATDYAIASAATGIRNSQPISVMQSITS